MGRAARPPVFMAPEESVTKRPAKPEDYGPPAYLNWLAMREGRLLNYAFECPLYSDAHITGETKHGPYLFLNAVPAPHEGGVQPTLVLRCDWYLHPSLPTWEKTEADCYHGGSQPEEIAALASLAMGVRLRAGDISREFMLGGDPKGVPRAWTTQAPPVLLSGAQWHRWVLPSVAEGSHPVRALSILDGLPELDSADAVSLVRAARSYQDALWLAESEPALAWLLLVSALETAANHWRSQNEEPLARLQASKPELFKYLEAQVSSEALNRVAEGVADSLGVTKKFVDFVMTFRPLEPKERPRVGRIDWSDESLRQIVRMVYRYRSNALHDGKPFPAPMCDAPYREQQRPAEKPMGLAASEAGGTWVAKDIPILLHTFEYIARHALLNWWRSLHPNKA